MTFDMLFPVVFALLSLAIFIAQIQVYRNLRIIRQAWEALDPRVGKLEAKLSEMEYWSHNNWGHTKQRFADLSEDVRKNQHLAASTTQEVVKRVTRIERKLAELKFYSVSDKPTKQGEGRVSAYARLVKLIPAQGTSI